MISQRRPIMIREAVADAAQIPEALLPLIDPIGTYDEEGEFVPADTPALSELFDGTFRISQLQDTIYVPEGALNAYSANEGPVQEGYYLPVFLLDRFKWPADPREKETAFRVLKQVIESTANAEGSTWGARFLEWEQYRSLLPIAPEVEA